MKIKKIVIAGGNGFLGKVLVRFFLNKGYSVISLNRKESKSENNFKMVKWDGKNLTSWSKEIEGSFAVINLCGRSVDCRYNQKNKDEILNSRLDTTRAIGLAIEACKNPPRVWINSSSATIYTDSRVRSMGEDNGEIGDGFSVEVCKAWENMVHNFKTDKTRQVLLRTSIVLGNEGGVFPVLSQLTRIGLGGKQGDGSQFVSWIHVEDFVNIVDFILNHPELKGAINCTAPQPVQNRNFMSSLRKNLGISMGIPANRIMLEIGAFFIRTETELILKSRKVVPSRLLDHGYKFRFPNIDQTVKKLCNPNIIES